MNKLESVMAYFIINYPNKQELSNARLTKLVYLADWFSALILKEQMTSIKWVFNHYGPFVHDIENSAISNPNFEMQTGQNMFGNMKNTITYSGDTNKIELLPDEKKIIQLIIRKTQPLYFNDFIDYVYSTYPVSANERYARLKLVELAEEYRNLKNKNQ
nr:Panacea domain-containing protein [uncultured Desulfobacter sp.]